MAAQEDLFQSAGIRPEGVIEDVCVDYNTELGRGSDATVYGATWRAPQANVAVKVLHPLLTEPQAGGREVLLRKYGDECNRLQNLRHDNVVRFVGVTRSREGTPALVTERMDTTLRHYSRTTELSLLEQLDILCDASAGLAYLHSRGVVHRDLTTRNVLLTSPPNRRAKLADVGLSRSLHGNWWFLNYGEALTRCPGTMSYMPPEALTERPAYDERLDSFSFGVLMMVVVLRRDPSTASLHSARERIRDGRKEEIPEVERRASDLNAIPAHNPLLNLIKQCLNNDSNRRPSARTIHENLHGIRTRLFPNAQRKPETDHCLDCQRSNQEVVRLNTEVASLWSRLEHQLQTNVQTSLAKFSAIQELRARLTKAEETVTTTHDREQDLRTRLRETESSLTETRRQEEDLRSRLREVEGSLMETRRQEEDIRAQLTETEERARDHEQDLQVRLSEAQNIVEATLQEASRTQEDLCTRLREAEGSLMETRRQEEDLRTQLREAEGSLMETRRQEEDLRARLTETEERARDHEQDLEARLSEAQNTIEATRQEASQTQEDLRTRLREAEDSLMEKRHQEEDLLAQLTETEESRLTETEESLTVVLELMTARNHKKDLEARLSEAQNIIEATRQEASRTQEDLRTQLREAEVSLMERRRQEEELQARLTETEESLMMTRDHEQDLQARLFEAKHTVEATRQEASQTQESSHNLEEQILQERERSTRERELLTAQLQQASSEMEEKIKSTQLLQQVYRYNYELAHRSWRQPRAKSHFGEWKTVHTNLPDDITSQSFAAVHADVLFVTFRSVSRGCVLYRSVDEKHWERIVIPPSMFSCHALVSYNGHLLSLFHPDKMRDPHQHLVIFELIIEDDEEDTIIWKQLPNGRCPILQHRPAVFLVEHKLVLAGGDDWQKKGSLSVVSEYCLETNHWITPNSWSSLPKAVTNMHAVCLGNLRCLVGGLHLANKNSSVNNRVFSVKVENGNPLGEFESTTVPPTPIPICTPCRVFGHLLVAGGFKSSPQDGVFLFDSASNAWLKMPPLKVARSLPTLVMFKDSLVCIGGRIGQRHTWCNQVEELLLSVKL